jgi:MOB kinase activator 1
MVRVQSIRMSLVLTMRLAVDFFNHLNMLYGTITEFCTAQEVCLIVGLSFDHSDFETSAQLCLLAHGSFRTCSFMLWFEFESICTRYEYLWEDGVKYKRPTKLPAPEYVDALMNWAQNILDDENVFPSQIGEDWSVHRPTGIFLHGYKVHLFQRTFVTPFGR